MRISDWSSDVCSSDLRVPHPPRNSSARGASRLRSGWRCGSARSRKCSSRRYHSARTSPKRLAPAHEPIPRVRRGSRSRPSQARSEEHTSELQSLMRISYAVFCLKKKKKKKEKHTVHKIKNNRLTIYQQRITTNN